MRVALVQLPLQSHDYTYSQENIPLAAGYLASYAAGLSPSDQVLICPPEIANLGGDAAILAWLEELGPDMVGFSCYLWNVQRTLHLCSMIRQVLDKCLIVLGGPEVSPDNDFLLSHDCFHTGVVGEGEEAFVDLLRAAGQGMKGLLDIPGLLVRAGSGIVFTGARAPMSRLDRIPSPYLNCILGHGLSRGMVLETVRGCPMRCAYCYYHKSAPEVRPFDTSRIGDELRWAARSGIEEVTLFDPCFARRPSLEELLGVMACCRPEAASISCELNAEDMTHRLVGALTSAGLAHVEIGLQSTNARTLRNIGRHFRKDAFKRGVKMLRSAGLRVMTDVMVGLPGDGLDDVKRSIDFVLEGDLCDDLSLYPLSVLPGTLLRLQAEGFGINYQHEPPYLAVGTADMDCNDIREAFSYAEEVAGRDFFPVELPPAMEGCTHEPGVIINRIVIDGKNRERMIRPEDIGQALCIEIRDSKFMETGFLGERIRPVLLANPFTLVSWIIPEGAYIPRRTQELISSLSSGAVHPADREYMAAFSPRRSTQLFLKGSTTAGRSVYTQVPIPHDTAMPIWAALPEDVGDEEELWYAERMEAVLGFRPDVRYHDLELSSGRIKGLTCLNI